VIALPVSNPAIVSQLNLVDLAGSERIALRHSDTQMKETSNINKSLGIFCGFLSKPSQSFPSSI
jgi:hypothetical protein